MGALEVARWQFGITTVYHFFFVPLTIGLSFLVAGLETAWVRTGHERYLRLTRFYGTLLLINIAMGVVTGIVQEFQFGMNWSAYSRYVGDIFGAPLAIEGLLAFFLESTFIGLWIFGWDRLSKGLHAATMWIVAFGSVFSAAFILVANSWMQHPTGSRYDPAAHRAVLTDFGAVLTNKVFLVTFPHTIAAAFMTAGAFVAGIALWKLVHRRGRADDGPGDPASGDPGPGDADRQAFRTALKVGAVTVLVAGVAVAISGDQQAKVMTEVQPMKMAAAEALYETSQPASFSIFTIGSLDGSREVFSIRIPRLLSFLATGSFDGKVEGINPIQAEYAQRYGPGSYKPIIPVTYWTFRLMIGFGGLAGVVALWALWDLRRGRTPRSRWLMWAGIVLPFMPLAANSFGWIFTEMGRQPWIVFGLMQTRAGVSPTTSIAEVLITVIGYTVLYGVLAVIEFGLMVKTIRAGLPEARPAEESDGGEEPLSFAY